MAILFANITNLSHNEEIEIPSLGEDVKEVEISFWLKKIGDKVEEGEDILEVITDKAVFRIQAPASGVLKEIYKKDGDKVKVGEKVGLVE